MAAIDRSSLAHSMIEAALARRESRHPPLIVTSANARVVAMCARDQDIRALLLGADAIYADSMPLVFVSRLFATPLPERVATTDLFHDVAELAQGRGGRFYFLGAGASVMEEAIRIVRRLYPGLAIAGNRADDFTLADEGTITAAIDAARPDILWLGMGVPTAQSFALRNRDRLRGVGVIAAAGGLFGFLSG